MPRNYLHTLRGYRERQYCESKGNGGMNIMVTRSGLTIKTVPKKIGRSQSSELIPCDSPPLIGCPDIQWSKAARTGCSWGNLSIITRRDLILKGSNVDFCGGAKSVGETANVGAVFDDRLAPFILEDTSNEDGDTDCSRSKTSRSCLAKKHANAIRLKTANVPAPRPPDEDFSFCCSGSQPTYEKCVLDGLEDLVLVNFCPPLGEWSQEFIQTYTGREDCLEKKCDGECLKGARAGCDFGGKTEMSEFSPRKIYKGDADSGMNARENKRKSTTTQSPKKRPRCDADETCCGGGERKLDDNTTQKVQSKGKICSSKILDSSNQKKPSEKTQLNQLQGLHISNNTSVILGLQKATSWVLTQDIKPGMLTAPLSPVIRRGDMAIEPCERKSSTPTLAAILSHSPRSCVRLGSPIVPMSFPPSSPARSSASSQPPMSPARSWASSHDSDDSQLKMEIISSLVNSDGKQMYKCQECDKLFVSYSAIKAHLLTHDSKTNLCAECGRAFTRNWLLQGHMRTHTGERPYLCPYPGCGKSFADKSNRRSHILIHTIKSKDFVCSVCKRAFAQKRYLHKHQLEVCFHVPK